MLGPLPSAALDPARSAALQAVLAAAVEQGAPDAIAAVITSNGTWSGAAGTGGPDGRKATARDEFAIASITKVFTAALMMRLSEEGRVDLDAPLSTYLGDTKADANGATVRQTLRMLGGFAEDRPDGASKIQADAGHVWTHAELLAEYGPPVGPPGATYLYSNPGYALLAMAAEHVTQTSFAVALRKELLDPVGADRILEQGPKIATPKPWAVPTIAHIGGYKPSDIGAGGAIPSIASATYSVGGASMASDAPSLADWMWRLFDGEVVKQNSLAAMTTIGASGYGLGMESLSDLGTIAYGHTGGKTGYGSIAAVFPAQRTVIVLFVNDPDFIVEPAVSGLLSASQP